MWENSVPCPLAWAVTTGRVRGEGRPVTPPAEDVALAGMHGVRCLLPTLLWDPLGWHPGVGAQLEAWYSARPSSASGHHFCQAEKEINERLRLRRKAPCALENRDWEAVRAKFLLLADRDICLCSGLIIFWP